MGLSEQLRETYTQAAREVKKKTDDFWAKHKAKAERMLKQVEAGKISMDDYKDWLNGQVFIGKRWKEKLDDITQTYVDADEKARQIINNTDKNVFVRFANSTAKDIEKKVGISFELYDKHTVERLLKKKPKLLPEWKINEPKDYRWNKKRVQNTITQGIIQGESIPDIGKRLTQELTASNARHMELFARTAVTGAQNAGRMDMLHRAQKEGVVVKKKWLAAHDARVRDAHAFLDGQTVEVDEPFVTDDGQEIMFPGDPSAPPELVYNCRCTMTYVYDVKASRENLREREEEKERLTKTATNSKMTAYPRNEGADVQYIGKIDAGLFENEFGKLNTNDVILTNERLQHIIDEHPQDYDYFAKYGIQTVTNPDIVIKDGKNENTVFMIAKLENTNLNTVVRLSVAGKDLSKLDNSIMTFYRIREKNLRKLIERNKVLYKRNGL